MHDSSHYFSQDLIERLSRQHYALFGHSAVKLCHYTKSSLTKGRPCYKQKFYGIQSHRCMQFTPTVSFCQQQCCFCWRSLKETKLQLKEFDEPEEIVEEAIKKQRLLLTGYGALKDLIGEKKLAEANNPNQVAISLSGEPTIYPKLSELIDCFHSKKFSSFLVSNGMNPKVLSELSLPSQLYLSLESPTKELHKKINFPLIKDSWEKLNQSLELFPSLSTRKCIRLTAIKGLNMCNEMDFAKLIEKAQPNFVEVKAYMFVGESRQRMKEENMPFHEEVKAFAERLNNHLNYNLVDEMSDARVVLLWDGKTKRDLAKRV